LSPWAAHSLRDVRSWGPVLAWVMLMKSGTNMSKPEQLEDAEGVPVSVKIRERIKAARHRFHSNDNIAEFIEPGELEKLLDEVTVKMQGVLDAMVIDTENDHNTGDTARRVAKMYLKEVFNGRYVKGPSVTEFPNAEHLNELMIVGPITVRSACSHHFCPVIGRIWIGVMPNEHTNVIGLSKYARLAEWIMGRPQIQEEAVVQLADLIQEKTQPDGLAIVMEASHYCMARIPFPHSPLIPRNTPPCWYACSTSAAPSTRTAPKPLNRYWKPPVLTT
jgi:GTP cyclohydrolase IA